MVCRSLFSNLLILTVIVAVCQLHPVQASEAQPIHPGDRVVTARRAPLMQGRTTLLTVEADTEMVAKQVKGEWVGVDVQREGRKIDGWIQTRYLRHATVEQATDNQITSAEEFRQKLDSLLEASRGALQGSGHQFPSAPYVAFSLKVARERVQQAGADFRSQAPEVWLLGGINRLRGFVYDRDNDDLILVGAIEAGRAPLTLDDLVVALRARLLLGEWPLVSIDPTPETEKTQLQDVRWKGGIGGTLFGLDLLTADYEMKGLALGYVEAGIPDFRSHWDRWLAANEGSASQQEEVGARFWFYPINPDVLTREGVCAIQGLTVGVFTEVLSVKIDGKPIEDLKGFKDAPGDAFAKELSQRFAELARDHYAFNRLRGLQELVGVSKALEQLDPRPELSWWLEEYRLLEVETPAELPVARRREQHGRRIAEISGGVHLTALALKVSRGDISALREAVLTTRPDPEALRWAFSVGKWVIPLAPGQVSPETIAALFQQAAFLQDQKRYRDAIALYDRMLELTADYSVDVWWAKAIALREYALWFSLRGGANCQAATEQWIREAIALWEKCLQANPRFAPAHYQLGTTLLAFGNARQAIKEFETACRLDAAYPLPYYGLGSAYRALGDLGKSVHYFREYLAQAENDSFAEELRKLVAELEERQTAPASAPTSDRRKIYNDEGLHLRFEYPASWSVLTREELRAKTKGIMTEASPDLVLAIGNPDDWDENVLVRIVPGAPKRGFSQEHLEELAKVMNEEMPLQLRDFMKVSQRVFDLNGAAAMEYVMVSTRMDTWIQTKQITFSKAGRAFIVTCTAKMKVFKRVDDDCFQVIVGSMRVW